MPQLFAIKRDPELTDSDLNVVAANDQGEHGLVYIDTSEDQLRPAILTPAEVAQLAEALTLWLGERSRPTDIECVCGYPERDIIHDRAASVFDHEFSGVTTDWATIARNISALVRAERNAGG